MAKNVPSSLSSVTTQKSFLTSHVNILDYETELSDMTASLPSLQFNIGTTESNMNIPMDILRARSHAITVSQCAQAIHFVYAVNKARMLVAFSKQKVKLISKFTNERRDEDPVQIGIVGCGRLGSQLAQLLLNYGRVLPKNLLISTRRPETLEKLKARGVKCFRDNLKIVNSVAIVFICVLPGQIEILADEIKSKIPKACILYSFVCAYQPKRLKILLDHRNIIVPQYSWDEDNLTHTWDYSLGIDMALEMHQMVDLTCPLSLYKDIMIYAFINLCTSINYSRSTIVKLINLVIFGISEVDQMRTSPDDIFHETDITKRIENCPNISFPYFDLCTAMSVNTPIEQKMEQSERLRIWYRHQYIEVFMSYINANPILFHQRHESELQQMSTEENS